MSNELREFKPNLHDPNWKDYLCMCRRLGFSNVYPYYGEEDKYKFEPELSETCRFCGYLRRVSFDPDSKYFYIDKC